MTTILLAVIFTAFIGLGLPDSLSGSAWPAIYTELNVSSSLNYCMTIPVTFCTIISSLLSGKAIAKFGTGKVAAFSTFLTATGIIGIYFSKKLWLMSLCGIPLGFGAGAIDSGLNAFVAKHYSASVMSFLHCSYGIGVAVSPYVISYAIKNFSWRTGYLIVFFIQLLITLVITISLPLWKKYETADEERSELKEKITTKELLKTKGLFPVLAIFFFTCAVEYLFGSWLTTYLVTQKGLLKETAAKLLTVYYVGMTSGRFLSGVFVKRFRSQAIIAVSFGVQIIAVATLFIPVGNIWLSVLTAFLGGLGVGPIFPNFTHLTPESFGEDKAARIMGLQFAASSSGILIVPFLYGLLSGKISHAVYPYALAFALAAALIATAIFKRTTQKGLKNNG